MSKKFVIIAIAAVSLTTFAVNGVAEAKHHGGKNMPQLTETQKMELKSMRNDFQEGIDPLAVELAAKRAELRAVLNGENPNPKDAARLAGDIEKLEQDMRDLEMAFREDISEKFDLPMDMHRGGNRGGHGNHKNSYADIHEGKGLHLHGGRE